MLLYEVLLARFFAITQWHHLSFMVISIALFGIAASGIFLNIVQRRLGGRLATSSGRSPLLERALHLCVILFTLSAAGAFLIVDSLPLDYFKLTTDGGHFLYLAAGFLLFSLPFFFSGTVSALGYAYRSERSGRIYFASMAGSAAGALLPIVLLPLLGVRNAILAAAVFPLIPIFGLAIVRGGPWPVHLVLIVAVGVLTLAFPEAGRVRPSSYKLLSHYTQYPGTRIVETRHSIRGRFDLVESPYIRFAPGLSLKYRGEMPRQRAVIRDGDDQLVLYDTADASASGLASHTLSYTGYALFAPADGAENTSGAVAPPGMDPGADALIIQRGGGLAVLCALASGARRIQLVEEMPFAARRLEIHYRGAGRVPIGTAERLRVIRQNPRVFLASSTRRYRIIHVESWGSAIPGMQSLSQEHLFTEEAFAAYLSSLHRDGALILTRRLMTPPADSLRLLATVRRVFSSIEPGSLRDHLAMARSWDAVTIIVSRSPLNARRLERLKELTWGRSFDLVYYPGMPPAEANRHMVLQEPYYFEAVRSVLAQDGGRFVRSYLLDIAPRSDDRPYHNHFLRWDRLGELLRGMESRFFALALSGEMILIIVFLTALAISFLLLFLPVILTTRRPPALILYFLALGAGFMFLEMATLKELTFTFGDPVLALSVVLASILLFSAAGGMVSDRIGARSLPVLLMILVALCGAGFAGAPLLAPRMLELSAGLRVVLSLLLIMPPSFLMGFPFPCAVRLLVAAPAERAYGWAANGSTSVLTSIAAVQLAMALGISRLFLAGGLAYAAALVVLVARRRNQ